MNEEDRQFGQPHHGHPDEDMMKKPDEGYVIVNNATPVTGAEYWRAIAQQVADAAERAGFIVTIERVPQEPLAMRNHVAKIDVREKR